MNISGTEENTEHAPTKISLPDFEMLAKSFAVQADDAQGNGSSSGSIDPNNELRERIIDVLHTCFDPEIPVNIYELGLIYTVDIDAEKNVAIKMTLTSPMCPVAGTLPPEVQEKVKRTPGVASVKVDVVWDPPWSKDMMSEASKLQLGIM